MTVDLRVFLTARLDEDKAIAQAATGREWSVDDVTWPTSIVAEAGEQPVAGGRWGGEAPVFEDVADAHHIARHDPARVLREVAAKRAIFEAHHLDAKPNGCPSCMEWDEPSYEYGATPHPCPTLRALASVYADHPDYRPEWAL